jgi:hypothetical protein
MRDDESCTEFDDPPHGGSFVDACEWMRQRGLPAPLPVPCAISAALWRRLERIPFRIVQTTTLEDRLQHLFARARACLAAYDVARACADRSELTLAFSASLPCRAEDPSRQILHLRCGSSELGATIALGLPDDLPLRPRELALARAYRAPSSAPSPAADAAPSTIHTLRRPRGESAGARLPA